MSTSLPHVADHIPERIKNDADKVKHFILGFNSGSSHRLFGIDTCFSEDVASLPEPQKSWVRCVLWGAAVRKELYLSEGREGNGSVEDEDEFGDTEEEGVDDLVSHFDRLQSGISDRDFDEDEEEDW